MVCDMPKTLFSSLGKAHLYLEKNSNMKSFPWNEDCSENISDREE